MRRGILGIGVCTLDVLTKVRTFPSDENVEEAEIAIVMGGGPIPTALTAAATLGSTTTMLDRLGEDWRSRLIIEELRGFGVNCDEIEFETGAEASLASVFVRSSDGARAIRFVRSTTKAIHPNTINSNIVNKHRIVHCNGRHLDACLKAADLCANSEGKTLLSFDGGADRFREELFPLMTHVDIAIVALDFALKASKKKITDELEPDQLGEIFPSAQIIVFTDGKRGSWIHPINGSPFHQPAFSINAVEDTTGCGDVYHGAFLHAIEMDLPIRQTARMASAAGAINATSLGGRGKIATNEDLHEFLASANEIR